ncbi:Protein of unknown function DUF538 [Macleaya cordata]|uniref:DUF538 domain-containing protein n=1 Tax=Macleaya cordata TaxID=56857 RepID=A0A200RD97_MACCD|nr:Protein of unknown function DUF538 [Macleaya cordata]
MAILQKFFLSLKTSLLFLSLLCFTTIPHQAFAITEEDFSSNSNPTTVHDLLPQFGFPKGLLPDAVKSYSLSDNGDFEVELDRPCYVHFDNLVYYDKKISGKLKYGVISDVSGIQAKKLFVWVTVTGIEVDSDSYFIEFHVGFLSEKLPAEQFQNIPTCKSKACHGSYHEDLISEVISQHLRNILILFTFSWN